MRLVIISVGKIKEGYLKEGVRDFVTRLRPYVNVELIEGLEEKTPPDPSPAQIAAVVEKEGERILERVRDQDFLVALDARGRMMDSETLAETMQNCMNKGISRVVFAVGGSHGLSPAVLQRADLTLSLSRMTFLHQMAVLILLEQIYRGFKIIRGEPYHK